MKLLIVDDEKLTREGIRDSLSLREPWHQPVYCWRTTAYTALKPPLRNTRILCSRTCGCRRMNGVQMAERILKELPIQALSSSFMSAYSDKEYLKAAIKLKAAGICGKTP